MAAAILVCMVQPESTANLPYWEDGVEGKDEENTRCWRPGEPLDWVRPGLIDSLHSQGFNSFDVIVESPKAKGYRKTVHYTREGAREAIYVEGDLRFISYDIPSRINASKSVVVGYSYFSIPYWFNGQLCFQNGQSNWYRHAHRHYHSPENGQIEMREASPAPRGVEKAIVFADDSVSYFLVFSGKLEESSTPALVYALPHSSMDWEFKGRLHPSITRLYSDGRARSLKDYWVISYSGSATVIRKSDLAITQVSSSLALKRKAWQDDASTDANVWGAVRGNEVLFNWNGQTVMEDYARSVEGAQWKPLFIPYDEPIAEEEALTMSSWVPPLMVAVFVAFGLLLVLRQETLRRKAHSANQIGSNLSDPGKPSPMLLKLMARQGESMSTHELDLLFGLSNIQSSETLRSKRSRIIQMTNMESMGRFGKAIIHRKRSDDDKRVMMYLIELPEGQGEA